ncbi:hypothetical protein N7470_008959 [Penicillium chermesinum]|nr:hypothetical protein N7470_008959 [Penicillium chermesinum]
MDIAEQFKSFLQNDTINYLRTSGQEHLQTHLSQIRTDYVQPYIVEPLSHALTYAYTASNTDLPSIFLLVLTICLSLVILDYARRLVMFWVRLVYSLVFWSAILGSVWYVYRFGAGQTLQDAAWLLMLVEGFVVDFVRKAVSGDDGAGFGAGSGRMDGRGGWGWGRG